MNYYNNQHTFPHNNFGNDQLDDASYHDDIPEEAFVGMMSNNQEFSSDGDHLDALPQQYWYHGKLSRSIAEERLCDFHIPCCYLVRESETKSGSYVLSFLSEKGGATHFRIISICGDFYIGGHQFDSLEDLISYYTHRSCLLEGEMLKHPVSPPEPVDDRRRVQAILPYQKVPDADNDELSFEKDDIFIVQNDMEGDWIWVTSQRTNESGCVFKGLVREVDQDMDPHEGKEWFHANISKEQAYNLLSAVNRNGSFLIRESDSTPGDYVLYFFFNNKIQRFKIHRKSYNKFEMGGRSYERLDDIVEHYKHEQIVEGYTLRTAIRKTTNISRECRVDIYETMNKATGSRAIINEAGVLKKGQLYKKGLGKKGHDTKKWKPMYFVLHGEKQHLYYFEHEKKTKPKGLIDLSYGAVYPVHESYFGRPHCFQIVVRALNEVSSSYFCADSSDQAQEWMKILRANCAKPNRQQLPKPNSARQVRSLQVHIEEAHRLVNKTSCRPYCTLSLNDVHVGRTKVKEGLAPVWSEEFMFDDIPPDVDSITIGVHNAAKRTKHAGIGEVVIHFRKLSLGKFTDEWYNLNAVNNSASIGHAPPPPTQSSFGSVRVRARYCNELIMPSSEYNMLKQLVTEDMTVAFALSQICGQDRTLLATVLLRIFRQQRIETELIRLLNEREIYAKDSEPGTLFRATTLSSTLMEQYMRSTCSSFVSLALKDVVKLIVESNQSCELNPAKLQDGEENDIELHKRTLLGYLRDVLSSILLSGAIFPKELRYIFGHLQHSVSRRWPNDPFVKVRVVSGFMFLRLLCPAILNPKMFNMISESPSPVATRSLLLVAKSIQNLANLIEFGAKEFYMQCVNSFIVENKTNIVQFIENLGNKDIELSNARSYGPKIDITRDLASLYQICKEHLVELQSLSNKDPSLKRLLGVMEFLNKQQANYQQRLREQDR